jgi:uncharacterized protein with ParB-like and HNH nuclease domain
MSETIEAKELDLSRIFSNDYRFEIPDYQRPYAWTAEQVDDLLDDLDYAIGDGINIQDKAPYFLGSIVIIKKPQNSLAHIVDGQQRITTLTILLCVLRELSSSHEFQEALTQCIREQSNVVMGIVGRYRLGVRKRDTAFFQNNIQEIGRLSDFLKNPPVSMSDSQKRMYENAKYLWTKLSQRSDERRNTLAQYIVQRCYLVVVSTSDQSSAYRIFSVLNDRGLDLSPTDILKADIIGGLDEYIRTDYSEKWEDMEEELSRDSFRELFAHIRMIFMKSKMRGTLQQEFQDNVLSRVQGKEFIDDVLEPYADAYEILTDASYRSEAGAEDVNKLLRYLNELDNFDWIPPALTFLKRNPTDTVALSQFLKYLERLAYGLFILRANINQRIRRYAEILRALEHEEDLLGASSPLQLSADEKTEILRVLDGQIYSHLRVRRPLLLRLNSLLSDVGVRYDYPTISIEHVLPQNPDKKSEWLRKFPDEEERIEWTGKLANLVLLSRRKNSTAQNYDFSKKKEAYFQRGGVATFALTTQVLNETEWTPEVLQRRQKYLIDALIEEWWFG